MLKMVDVFSGSPRSFATQAGTDITMVKATQATGYVNPFCDTDYQAAKRAGKLLGVYHYCGGGNARAEAEYFYNNIKNYIGEAVPAVDWESYQNSSWGDAGYVRVFVDRFHELSGVWPLIYVQQSAINQVANCANDCGLWVAWYASMSWTSWSTPNVSFSIAPWQYYTIWQFTGGDMDRNVVNVTAEGWKKMANPQMQSAPEPEANPVPKPETPAVPKAETWVDDLGDTWHSEDGKFVLNTAVNLRYGARTNSNLIATLPAGSIVKYDAWSRHAGYVWLRQPRGNSYGYLACRDAKTNKAFGTFK